MKKGTKDWSVTIAVAMVFFATLIIVGDVEAAEQADNDTYHVDQYGTRQGLASQTRDGKTYEVDKWGARGRIISVVVDGKIYEVDKWGARGRIIGIVK